MHPLSHSLIFFLVPLTAYTTPFPPTYLPPLTLTSFSIPTYFTTRGTRTSSTLIPPALIHTAVLSGLEYYAQQPFRDSTTAATITRPGLQISVRSLNHPHMTFDGRDAMWGLYECVAAMSEGEQKYTPYACDLFRHERRNGNIAFTIPDLAITNDTTLSWQNSSWFPSNDHHIRARLLPSSSARTIFPPNLYLSTFETLIDRAGLPQRTHMTPYTFVSTSGIEIRYRPLERARAATYEALVVGLVNLVGEMMGRDTHARPPAPQECGFQIVREGDGGGGEGVVLFEGSVRIRGAGVDGKEGTVG